jgi:hypothetical protein
MARRRILIVMVVAAVLVAVPVAVIAVTGSGAGRADRQRFAFRTGTITTSSTSWTDIPGLSGSVCGVRAISATVSVNLSGGSALFRVQVDSGAIFAPGAARFTPPGTGVESFSYTFVNSLGTFEGSDGHFISVQWRSATGAPVSMGRGALNLIFQAGTCP